MRTAEEIFDAEYQKAHFITHQELAEICIKVARDEAIKEAAEIVRTYQYSYEDSVLELLDKNI